MSYRALAWRERPRGRGEEEEEEESEGSINEALWRDPEIRNSFRTDRVERG